MLSRAINQCWCVFCWLVLLAAVVAGTYVGFFYYHRENFLRRQIVSRLSQHYPNLKVHLRAARLIEGQGIQLLGLRIVEPGATGPQPELFSAAEVWLECSSDWAELFRGELQLRRVTLRRPLLRLTRREDGSWSAAKLWPLPRWGEFRPSLRCENGVLEIFDPTKSPSSTLVFNEVSLEASPSAEPEQQNNKTAATYQLCGLLQGDGFKCLELNGEMEPEGSHLVLSGRLEGLNFSPQLYARLPNPWANCFAELSGFSGSGDFLFRLSYDPNAIIPRRFEATGRISNGRFEHPNLPQPLREINAYVRLDNGGADIEELRAFLGDAELQLSCRRAGYEPTDPLRLTARVRQLDLCPALAQVLPESLQRRWREFQPAGKMDAELTLDYDGRAWQPELTAQYTELSFSHHKFPYRLEHGRGRMEIKNNRLKLACDAKAGKRPVRLVAEVNNPFTKPSGWCEIQGENIPVDESLLAALPEKNRAFIQAIDLQGSFDFHLRVWREHADAPLCQRLLLTLKQCQVRYEKFPYPLRNVRGEVAWNDGVWTFRNLEGTNDTAHVACRGSMTPVDKGHELMLEFSAHNVPLEEELCQALSPAPQGAWRRLRPTGAVNFTAEVRYLTAEKKFSINLRAQPCAQTVSIKPIGFPYRLDKLEGVLNYRDGRVSFENCRAIHGPVKLAADGDCELASDGRWRLRFAQLKAENLQADRELVQALPNKLKTLLQTLKPEGGFNLQGALELSGGEAEDSLQANWSFLLGLNNTAVSCGELKLENIAGAITLHGEFDGRRLGCRGEADLASLQFEKYRLSQVRGPIWIDEGRLLLGSWVDRKEGGSFPLAGQRPRSPQPLTAALFGGTLYADGWVALTPQAPYALNLTLLDADLSQWAQEVNAGHHLCGKIVATADLTGSGRDRNSLSGRGMIRLSEGDVYELPLMVALLKILSIRPPDQNAFSDGLMEYYVKGRRVYFDRIEFYGDAISLRGSGEMDENAAIRLKFYTLVGRNELPLPLIKELYHGASQQLMLIHVTGTLQNPQTRKEALPAVTQALQQLREELQNRR